ncbi:MAG TPA: hypothetical protein VJ974_07410 [Geopsychrobacteraceae bacterium]|nr:hypothetical protein [Geopsychrobacteraceae bacterium]
MKTFLLCLFFTLFTISPLFAETVDISSKLKLHFDIPDTWVSDLEPPQALVDIMAEHIGHDAAQKGRHPSQGELQQLARKRFAENEALLFNPESHAFLSLDFSPLRQGERAPSHKSIKLSARYAGESLSNEEGVSDLTTTESDIEIDGAWYSHRFDATYKHHDNPISFTGIVGFASPYWFYFYYTDYLRDSRDREALEKIIRSLKIESR